MENKKGQVGSASSFTSQLFGPQQSSSSNDVFASIFPPSKGVGRNSGFEVRGSWLKEPASAANQPCNTRQDNTYKHRDANCGNSGSNEKNSIYHQEGAVPCNLSSSLYYGGQETYSKSTTQSMSSSYHTFKKDGENDSSTASRGDWWQGSLYY